MYKRQQTQWRKFALSLTSWMIDPVERPDNDDGTGHLAISYEEYLRGKVSGVESPWHSIGDELADVLYTAWIAATNKLDSIVESAA